MLHKLYTTKSNFFGREWLVCQLDESLFRHKPKYHHGRATTQELWVFGIVDTSYIPARGYMELVENRSAAVLLPIVRGVVRENSIIHSDEWAAYRRLNEMGYVHGTVNHKLNFFNPVTGAHSQNVESYWNKQKLRSKVMKGISGMELESYLAEWMWRDNQGIFVWQNLLDLIKFYY